MALQLTIWESFFYGFRKRIDYCANSSGAHFENFYHYEFQFRSLLEIYLNGLIEL